ncbi:Rieske (2Fe-2S) protein [Litoribrevibacter albus]|uniref:Rieske domain-containing protein n=1 Tax=Litoribrevibacter albus TaxID=1473156 RepID=A0AA37S879_9GAMM|nr:Rieske 2Fe-2S domain-containing protein [Litoribrevibacter albus]GLQ30997.1 hypothetical protein GCM10007876_14760 [Litoribrevibacter albus]
MTDTAMTDTAMTETARTNTVVTDTSRVTLMAESQEYREEGTFLLSHEGKCYRLPRHCPHRAGRLDHGKVNWEKKTIACPLHQSVFRIDTGEQVAGPECGSLTVEISSVSDEHAVPKSSNLKSTPHNNGTLQQNP